MFRKKSRLNPWLNTAPVQEFWSTPGASMKRAFKEEFIEEPLDLWNSIRGKGGGPKINYDDDLKYAQKKLGELGKDATDHAKNYWKGKAGMAKIGKASKIGKNLARGGVAIGIATDLINPISEIAAGRDFDDAVVSGVADTAGSVAGGAAMASFAPLFGPLAVPAGFVLYGVGAMGGGEVARRGADWAWGKITGDKDNGWGKVKAQQQQEQQQQSSYESNPSASQDYWGQMDTNASAQRRLDLMNYALGTPAPQRNQNNDYINFVNSSYGY